MRTYTNMCISSASEHRGDEDIAGVTSEEVTLQPVDVRPGEAFDDISNPSGHDSVFPPVAGNFRPILGASVSDSVQGGWLASGGNRQQSV